MNLRRLLTTTAVAAVALSVAPASHAGTPSQNLQREINQVRVQHGLFKLHRSTGLTEAAARHSRDMLRRGYFAHTSPRGVSLADRVARSRFRTVGRWYAGEVLSWSYGTERKPVRIVARWMASPPHRAVLLSRDPRFSWIGLAKVEGRFKGHNDVRIWTVDLGQR